MKETGMEREKERKEGGRWTRYKRGGRRMEEL